MVDNKSPMAFNMLREGCDRRETGRLEKVLRCRWGVIMSVSSVKRTVFAAFALLLAAIAVPSLALASTLSQGGSLSIRSSSGNSHATYRAVCIADKNALPIDSALDWESLSGRSFGSLGTLPHYDSTAPDAPEQGRSLVEAVSKLVSNDDDGSAAAEIVTLLASAEQVPGVEVAVDHGSVAVENGWWLLVSSGRRPLFAWVDGEPVQLGDKMDTPTLDKEVRDNVTGTWGDSGTFGSGQQLTYRLTLTVPESLEEFSTYWVEIHDQWDSRLSLVAHSVHVKLMSGGEQKEDITDAAKISSTDTSFTVRIDDLLAISSAPGDTVVVTYTMEPNASEAPGAEGLVNDAWAKFPHFDGDGETPHDRTRVYAFQVSIKKVTPTGTPLAGAVFALRDADGAWLAQDGTFGAASMRAAFTTDQQGLTSKIPLLAPGSYTLVELKAPHGYALPDDPTFPFSISAEHSFEQVNLTVNASGETRVDTVNATEGAFSLCVVNQPVTPPSGGIPQTWDALSNWEKLGVVLMVAGALAIVLAALMRRNRAQQEQQDKQGDQ